MEVYLFIQNETESRQIALSVSFIYSLIYLIFLPPGDADSFSA